MLELLCVSIFLGLIRNCFFTFRSLYLMGIEWDGSFDSGNSHFYEKKFESFVLFGWWFSRN